jgi:2-keto-myo-inositol isomerase
MAELNIGINRMVSPALELNDFLQLAEAVSAKGVELRNDLPGYDVTDHLEPGQVADMLARRNLSVLSINAVQHFNLPAEVASASKELRRLITFAAELDRPAIVMCPHCDMSDTRSRTEMAKDTKRSLKEYLPILDDAGVIGLVEPLGFPESSLRDAALAAEIIGEIGSNAYKLTLDTFHFAVAGMNTDTLATDSVPADLVGLVHVSGVKRKDPVESFRDPDRGYVDKDDRCGNIRQVQRLLSGGYNGAISFEPFSPVVHSLKGDSLKQAIVESINYIKENVI